MADQTRMTTERFFGGVNGRMAYLHDTLGFIKSAEPNETELMKWILDSTPAGTETTVRRNIAFLVSIGLIRESEGWYELTNKGAAYYEHDNPAVIYEGLATAVDGFREIARAIASGHRTVGEIQGRLRSVFPDYALPEGVVQKHLDWLLSLELVTETDGEYAFEFERGAFEVGETYSRWLIHDVLKGERYKGIAKPSDYPFIIIVTGESGSDYGYKDEFLDDDTFLYSGEGAEGDMTMENGNKALRDHKQNGEAVHLFEDTDLPWIVTYVGEFEYDSHQVDTLADADGRMREAIRFRLVASGGTDVDIGDRTLGSMSAEELFQKGKQSSPRSSTSTATTNSTSSGGKRRKRSEVVREFALETADGVCQGCGEPAPFKNKRGQPFLEVHHLKRLTDGGPDDPENVIALCPNCHRRRHQGRDGDAFNQELIEKAELRNEQFSN
ncbi:HNH endonuclease [Halomarina salina]|uniref:HNH endonuclease n=1 Tax=Halomarina salina TaxID=1872699 RepID=A0ABD5RR09_9EURY|nr:HNH endonuclease [Halomarina salina]